MSKSVPVDKALGSILTVDSPPPKKKVTMVPPSRSRKHSSGNPIIWGRSHQRRMERGRRAEVKPKQY